MHALDALGSPVRRDILRELQVAPLTVGELATRFPVSRPAISRHLHVLREAGLVEVRPQRGRGVYAIRVPGVRHGARLPGRVLGYGARAAREIARS